MMRLVAELYYLRDQSQATIADLTGYSVAKVSRLLARARESGIVRISVQPTPDQLADLAGRVAAALHIEDAYLTPGHSDDPVRATRLCAVAAAPRMAEMIPDAGVLGLAGGYTIAALVDALPQRSSPRLTIVPLVGAWDPATPYLDINELARRAAERLECRYLRLPAPGRLDSAELKRALLDDSAIRRTTEYWDRLTVALLGISVGPLAEPGYTTVMERLEDPERHRLMERGIVGDTMGHLFTLDGTVLPDPSSDRTVAAPLDSLRNAALVVAIAAGPHKVDGIIGACRTGLIHVLVTDEPTATAILHRLEEIVAPAGSVAG
jgi:DNA-binding transcriptional regulator LsrR (DeoR family)